jgi:hypothetical protein
MCPIQFQSDISSDKTSPQFKPFWIGRLPEKCLPIQTLLYASLIDILMSLAYFMGIPNAM